jgi:NitT/TauT family transport system substrate-binding protein
MAIRSLASAALRIAGCALVLGSLAAPSARAAEPPVLRVATIPVDTAADVFYAEEKGFFKAAGLNVQIQPMTSGPVIAQAVVGGSVDIGVANVATIAAARVRGLPLKFIAPAAIATPETKTDAVMVPKDSTIRSGADLNGKTVGINGLRDLQQIEAMGWIDKNGGDAKTVRFVEVPFPQMGGALEAHRVDADLPVEPFVTADRAVGRVIGQAPQGVAPRLMIVGWFASDAWLAAHPDLAAKFVDAIDKANAWSNAHQKETASILVRYTKLSASVAGTMARSTYGTSLDPALLQPVLDAARHYAIIDKPISASDLIWRAPSAR